MKRLWIALTLMLGLAACGTIVTSPTATIRPEKLVTVSPQDVLDPSQLEAGNFKVLVEGAIEHEFEGRGLYAKMEDGSLFLTLTNPRDAKRATISIVLPPDTQPGEFAFYPYETAIAGETDVKAVAAGFSVVAAQGSGDVSTMYLKSPSGTITLQNMNPISGKFLLKTQDDSGRVVTVSGSFNQVALSE